MFRRKSNSLNFSDGSWVEYVDRETIKYREGDYSVLVWVDYFKTRFLCYGRAINIDAIEVWDTYPDDAISEIDSKKRD